MVPSQHAKLSSMKDMSLQRGRSGGARRRQDPLNKFGRQYAETIPLAVYAAIRDWLEASVDSSRAHPNGNDTRGNILVLWRS